MSRLLLLIVFACTVFGTTAVLSVAAPLWDAARAPVRTPTPAPTSQPAPNAPASPPASPSAGPRPVLSYTIGEALTAGLQGLARVTAAAATMARAASTPPDTTRPPMR